jgi:integrase
MRRKEITMSKRGKYGHGRVYQPKYKAPDGTTKLVNKWYVQYYDQDGQQHREPTDAKTEREARSILAVKLGQVHTGTMTRTDEKFLQYGDIREDLLHHFRINKMASLEILADGTESAKGLTKLDEYFGFTSTDKGMKIAVFSSKHWEDNFVTKRRREGVSDATIVNSAKLLDRMFKLAVENKRMSAAPKVMIPTSPDAREEYLSKEQFDALIGANGMEPRFHPVLTFLFYQGVRITETMNIRWRQIDLDNGVFNPKASENKTKNKETKPLQRETIKALRTIEEGGDDDFVFEQARSEGGNVAKKFEKAFRAAMLRLKFGKPTWQCSQCRNTKDAAAPGPDSPAIECSNPDCKKMGGIPMQYHYVGPTPHALRASTVVFYRESGMSDPEIMQITGHKSLKSFLGYSRTRIENVKTRMDAAETMRRKTQKKLELVA